MKDAAALKAAIRAEAARLGFDAVGFVAPEPGAAGARLDAFLAAGRHGGMGWMEEKAAWRRDPRALWPAVRTAIALGVNYGPAGDPLQALARRDRGTVSVYAQGRDYHDVVKPRLKQLAGWLQRESGAAVKVFVDTAPVMEKPLAERAGLGWQGKHTNLVSREFGSWLLLGEVFTDLELPPDAPEADRCGRCRACLEICPTAAFPAPYQLDARRCLSYLTIEHKGPIPVEFRAPLGNRIYGCDDCLAVCPWNKFAARSREAAFLPRVELTAPLLADLAALDDAGFRQVFAGSPVKRIGRDRFLRNVLIALGNSGDPSALPAVEARLADGAALVRGAAVWALARLASPQRLAALRASHVPDETDPDVAAEWRLTFARGPGEQGAGDAMICGSDVHPEETS
ncbi:MAG: tRNA epoxyqueuosine(34) reductase QueG [Dongiaceae bacterium]